MSSYNPDKVTPNPSIVLRRKKMEAINELVKLLYKLKVYKPLNPLYPELYDLDGKRDE